MGSNDEGATMSSNDPGSFESEDWRNDKVGNGGSHYDEPEELVAGSKDPSDMEGDPELSVPVDTYKY